MRFTGASFMEDRTFKLGLEKSKRSKESGKKQEDIPGKNLSILLKQGNKTSWQMNGIKEMLQH